MRARGSSRAARAGRPGRVGLVALVAVAGLALAPDVSAVPVSRGASGAAAGLLAVPAVASSGVEDVTWSARQQILLPTTGDVPIAQRMSADGTAMAVVFHRAATGVLGVQRWHRQASTWTPDAAVPTTVIGAVRGREVFTVEVSEDLERVLVLWQPLLVPDFPPADPGPTLAVREVRLDGSTWSAVGEIPGSQGSRVVGLRAAAASPPALALLVRPVFGLQVQLVRADFDGASWSASPLGAFDTYGSLCQSVRAEPLWVSADGVRRVLVARCGGSSPGGYAEAAGRPATSGTGLQATGTSIADDNPGGRSRLQAAVSCVDGLCPDPPDAAPHELAQWPGEVYAAPPVAAISADGEVAAFAWAWAGAMRLATWTPQGWGPSRPAGPAGRVAGVAVAPGRLLVLSTVPSSSAARVTAMTPDEATVPTAVAVPVRAGGARLFLSADGATGVVAAWSDGRVELSTMVVRRGPVATALSGWRTGVVTRRAPRRGPARMTLQVGVDPAKGRTGALWRRACVSSGACRWVRAAALRWPAWSRATVPVTLTAPAGRAVAYRLSLAPTATARAVVTGILTLRATSTT